MLFSAAYSTRGNARRILLRAIRKELIWVISQLVISETKRNIAEKAPGKFHVLETIIDNIPFEFVRLTKRQVMLQLNILMKNGQSLMPMNKLSSVQQSEFKMLELPEFEMKSLIEKREEYINNLDQTLERVLDKLRAIPTVQRVILFGSHAAGKRDLLTDLDLLVVMESELDFITRTAQLYVSLQPGIDMDLLVYTPKEFEDMKDGNFLRTALEGGKVLYEKDAA